MSVALFIVAEREVEDLEMFVNGKALGRSQQLDLLANRAGVRPLMEFFSQEPTDLDDPDRPGGFGVNSVPVDSPPAVWYAAEEGLETVRGMLAAIEEEPDSIPDAAAVCDDLREFERVLSALAQHQIRWHLAVDI